MPQTTLTPEAAPGLWPTTPAHSAAATAAAEWHALAPVLAARGVMRVSFDGGNSYPRRRRSAAGWVSAERPLPPEPPPMPAAVHVYTDDATTRLLAADFDIKRAAGRGAADPDAQVASDAAAFADLIHFCGGRGFGDISPNRGRHAYVLWAAPVPYEQMRWVAMALARRFISLDPSPMLGRQDGLIRPPGSRHRSGGYQTLTTPLGNARRCVAQPCGPLVWERLREALSAEIEDAQRGQAPLPPPPLETAQESARWRIDDAGARWLPRRNGRIPVLRPDLELTAVAGEFDTGRQTYDGKPWTPSDARFAVLCSAAARGWRLEEVTGQMRSGAWSGLARFYHRYPPRHRARRLAADWDKAVTFAATEQPVRANSDRDCTTRENNHTGGRPASRNDHDAGADGDYQQVRRIDAAMRAVEVRRWPGPAGIRMRLVMRALLAAAQMTGSVVIEFGCRSLAIGSCSDHTTVARALQRLRAEPDPFVVLLESRRGVRGDLLMLQVPEALAEEAAWRQWRPGRLGVHPVFHALGGPAALVFEQLASEPVRAFDLPVLTGLSPTTISTALADLGAHGLAERHCGGWRRGRVDPDQVAVELGIPAVIAHVQAQHRADRQHWRAWLMRPQSTPADPRPDDIPWPDQPPPDDLDLDLLPARGPPAEGGLDAMTAALAVIESTFGAVRALGA